MTEQEDKTPKTLWAHLRRGLRDARSWRPSSFYFLLATPLVLLLAAHMLQYRDNPKRFALVLALLFVFFGVLLIRALMDLLDITRRRLREERKSFQETLGDREFLDQLGNRLDDHNRGA